MRSFPIILVFCCLALTPAIADAGTAERGFQVAQNGGKSLSEAVEQVRRQTGGRIVSAETKVKNGREVHYIKVLTDDGKVKTHTVQGRTRGNG